MNRLSTIVPPPYRAPVQIDSTTGEDTFATAMTQERLPFTVRIVSNETELSKAVSIRADAYGRHMPEFGEKLRIAATQGRTKRQPAALVARSTAG